MLKYLVIALLILGLLACSHVTPPVQSPEVMPPDQRIQQVSGMASIVKPPASSTIQVDGLGKPVVYQVFTRLFGNTNTNNRPWGTIADNGVGKFSDFTDTALSQINQLGVTHIWYTGVLHHALVNDYTEIGVSHDDPDVVKGRAGSPYAIKDYYTVSPDLADDPAQRLSEFEALIERTHRHGMRVIIDIVPNHVARHYQSVAKPAGVEDFGAGDDQTLTYAKNNNFYYIPDQAFKVPKSINGYQPLGGANHPLADGHFTEYPAKWTGNGSRQAQPDANDWYETVKVNFGVRPDGGYDFSRLPKNYSQFSYQQHAQFWQGKKVPDTWIKFRQVVEYWLAKGVDGFRYDMAEMVPVEFWSYLNSRIKLINPDAFLLAEVYDPNLYRDYLHLGKMDYLYDKVGFYDTLKAVIQGTADTSALLPIITDSLDIDPHMLHFMENHDEQRISSVAFAGSPERGKPGMVVSTLIRRSPTMVYFGQEVGEAAVEDLGFGDPTRTSIFDYGGVPAHQRWMNDGAFDGGQLTSQEKQLREFYQRLLTFSATQPALTGNYQPIHAENLSLGGGYTERQLAFVRWRDQQRVLVVSNFADHAVTFSLQIPANIIDIWQLMDGMYSAHDALSDDQLSMKITNGIGWVEIRLAPYQSRVLDLFAQ